jgi:hypothetical protein
MIYFLKPPTKKTKYKKKEERKPCWYIFGEIWWKFKSRFEMSDELQQTLKKQQPTYDQARANHCVL